MLARSSLLTVAHHDASVQTVAIAMHTGSSIAEPLLHDHNVVHILGWVFHNL